MLHNKVINKLETNRERRLSGDVVAIPYPFLRLSEYLPGIEQGKYINITGSQKSGKTQVADFIFVFNAVDWWIENKHNTDITLKIIYFSLEVSRELKILSAISYKLFKSYNIAISPQKLRSVFQKYILDKEVLSIIKSKEFTNWLKEFENIVEIHEDIRNPYGCYKIVKAYAEKNGTYEYEEVAWTNEKVIKGYKPNNSNEFVEVIWDHIGLLQPEKGGTIKDAINDHSSKYCLSLRDRFNYIPIDIQQQSADSQTSAYDYRGNLIIDRVKPTVWGLGENRTTGRNYNLMFSIFWPYYYNVSEYNNIDLSCIGNNHRELSILLNRDGMSNLAIDLFFLGSANHFKELPKEMNESVYKKIKEIKQLEI